MQHLVQLGAGSIGRSFLGALFAQAGWRVTFVDVDETVVCELNRRGGQPVVVKHPDLQADRLDMIPAENLRDRAAFARTQPAAGPPDRHGFLGPVPQAPGVQLVDTIAAYVDRKLFRFGNRALGDTVYRVGRDLRRRMAG